MACFDSRLSQIVIRIVYDGAGSAGKTTNLKALQDLLTRTRRGELITPETTRGRTLYFDHLQLEGGLIAGHRFRCELFTVPGQQVLRRRRLFLLERADVVVFVVDSRPKGVEEARGLFGALRAETGELRVPVVVQANKQDYDGAISPEDVRAALAIPPGVTVIGAMADTGAGVRDTTLLAMRCAAMSLQRKVIEEGPESFGTEVEEPAEIHRKMRALRLDVPLATAYSSAPSEDGAEEPHWDEDLPEEPTAGGGAHAAVAGDAQPWPADPEPAATSSDAEPAAASKAESVSAEEEPALAEVEERSAPAGFGGGEEPDVSDADGMAVEGHAGAGPRAVDPAPAASVASMVQPGVPCETDVRTTGTSLPQVLPDGQSAPILPSSEVRSFHIWPPASGRELLRLVPFERAEFRFDLQQQQGKVNGSGKFDTYIYRAGNWCLKTSARRCYADQEEAHSQLVQLARRKVGLGDYLPPNTVLVLQKSDMGLWLWTVTPWLPSLRSDMAHAEAVHSHSALSLSLQRYAQASVGALRVLRDRHIALDVNPSNFAYVEDRVVYLDDDILAARRLPTIGYAWLMRVEEYRTAIDAVEHYLSALEQLILKTLSQEDVSWLGLEEAVEETLVQSDIGREARLRLANAIRSCR